MLNEGLRSAGTEGSRDAGPELGGLGGGPGRRGSLGTARLGCSSPDMALQAEHACPCLCRRQHGTAMCMPRHTSGLPAFAVVCSNPLLSKFKQPKSCMQKVHGSGERTLPGLSPLSPQEQPMPKKHADQHRVGASFTRGSSRNCPPSHPCVRLRVFMGKLTSSPVHAPP